MSLAIMETASTPDPAAPPRLSLTLVLRRLGVAALAASLIFGLFLLTWEDSRSLLALRLYSIAAMTVLAYSLFERWPRRLPAWMARWALQVLAVGLAIVITTLAFYVLSTPPEAPPFWAVRDRLTSFLAMTLFGLLLGPWIALSALLRQRDALVRRAERERIALERQAQDARMRLLQAQVQPHFLFNTLANLQALVDSGSPQASVLLQHLVIYLRAAVPRLVEPASRLGQELELVQAYLALMRMRMPDRLVFEIAVQPGCERLRCPPMTLMTLVENAIRHGIDPSLEGGRIDIQIAEADGRCRIAVSDTGLGLASASPGLGTGLASLRERLALAFEGDASVQIHAPERGGFSVVIDCPALP